MVKLTTMMKGDIIPHSEDTSPATTIDAVEEGYEIASDSVRPSLSSSSIVRISAGASVLSEVSIDPYADLDPPLSRGEHMRDGVLQVLDWPMFQTLGLMVLFLVILDGAIFFFFLMGWQTLCDTPSRIDCEPRDQIYNASVQILNGLFTYMAVISLPWRWTQAAHTFGLSCPSRTNHLGHDIYGVKSNDVWYHIPLRHRQGILICLLLNCLSQYANQVTRLMYRTYTLQSTMPGLIWVNVFFGTSMIFAAIGGAWMGLISERVRQQHPERFGPGPIQVLQAKVAESEFGKRFCRCCCSCCCCCCYCSSVEVAQLEVANLERERHEHPHPHPHHPRLASDPLRDSLSVLGDCSRTELRMFGM